ncbi:MAG: hypothetical protein GF418_02235 [Chitinivibrionales bacterium]|nr:hypothetical protein [Chitinivibrionales bacterium]MBD3394420.1 hypothetical protein [Chitinivibrionales bacterium]
MIPRPTEEHDVDRVETVEKRGCVIFRVREDLTLYSRFDRLTALVMQALDGGKVHIAFSFTPDSYLSTRLISNLVNYWNRAREQGGSLGLIRPNLEIVAVLKTIGLSDLISVYDSEDTISPPDQSP